MKEHLDEFDKFMVELGKLSPETHPELYAAWMKYKTLLSLVIPFLLVQLDVWEQDKYLFGEDF
jgi:hypothetical protein